MGTFCIYVILKVKVYSDRGREEGLDTEMCFLVYGHKFPRVEQDFCCLQLQTLTDNSGVQKGSSWLKVM